MNKPRKCKNCQWYGKPYWSVINPCDNCDREDYYKAMESYYTEDYVNFLLQQIDQLTNNWNELEEWLEENKKICKEHDNYTGVNFINIVLDKMKEIKEGNNE